MDLFRHTLKQRPAQFLEIADECCQPPFALEAERYKRPLVKDLDPAIANWYQCKTFAVMVTDNDVEKLFHAGLVNLLAEGFRQLEPLYQWLMTVETMKQIDPDDL
jgi:hypothetical protein